MEWQIPDIQQVYSIRFMNILFIKKFLLVITKFIDKVKHF